MEDTDIFRYFGDVEWNELTWNWFDWQNVIKILMVFGFRYDKNNFIAWVHTRLSRAAMAEEVSCPLYLLV
jgi:hypothetical protein